MAYRLERVSHVVRDVVSDAIANRLSDPRVSRFTSVTRVEMTRDLRIADVYVSVMGSPAEGETTMEGLASAAGLIQSRLAKRLDLRLCPSLRFHLDRGLKIAIETIRRIDEALSDSPADAVRADDGCEPAPRKPPGLDADPTSSSGVNA